MCKRYIVMLIVGLLIVFVNHSKAQELGEVTCSGRVVDSEGKPVEGAWPAPLKLYHCELEGIR